MNKQLLSAVRYYTIWQTYNKQEVAPTLNWEELTDQDQNAWLKFSKVLDDINEYQIQQAVLKDRMNK